jgi:hypothetical protein
MAAGAVARLLLTCRQASEITGFSEAYWRKRIWLGSVDVVRIGRAVRIPASVIENLIASGSVPGPRAAIAEVPSMSARAVQYVKSLSTSLGGEPFTAGERAVLLYLADAYNDERRAAWPILRTVATYFGVTRRAIERRLAELVRKGVIWAERRPERRGRNVSHYWHLTGLDGAPSAADVSRYREVQERGRASAQVLVGKNKGCQADTLSSAGGKRVSEGCQTDVGMRHGRTTELSQP